MPVASAMRRLFGLSSRGRVPSGPSGQQGSCGDAQHSARPKAVGKLHKAASVGDTARVEQRLMLRKSGVNDRDKKHRTALHFACVYGHPEVVTLLVEKKCDIDAHDRENSTALIKAVQYHQEECATILLEHGANPNVADASGNTALHYAVYCGNTSIAAKLLLHHADTEAKNKDDLTPHSLAVRENKQQVAELLIKETDERGRFSNKRDPFDSSEGDDDNFDDMNLPKVNLAELWAAAHQCGEKQAKYGTGEPGNTTPLEDSISAGESKDNVETDPKTSNDVQSFSQSSVLSLSREESTVSLFRKAAEGKVRGCQKYKRDVSLPLGLRKDDESPWDSESISENLPQKPVAQLSGAADEKGNHTGNTQVEESSEKCLHLKPGIERKNPVRKKAVAKGDLRTCNSDFSEIHCSSTTLSLPDKTCQRSGNLKVDDKYSHITQAVTKPLSPSTEFGKTALIKVPEEGQERLDGCIVIQEQVSVSHKDLCHKNHRFQDETARLRLEINAIKSQSQGKEKKYLEDIEIAREKTDNLQRTIKRNEERIFQHNGQLNSLTVENTMPNSKLENEKQIKKRLETETESHRSRLSAAVQDYDERQTSKRDVELAFQRARDEWVRLQDKLNFDLSNLKDTNEMLSQQLSQAERRFSSLEIELHHTRDALREKTSALEQAHREQNQAQCQMEEIKLMYQNEQIKVNKCMQKQESLEERLSQLKHEDALLRKQLDDAHKKVDDKEKPAINIQDQFQEEFKKQYSMLEDKNNELIKENNHLKDRLCQCEKENAEKGVVMRYLQQEMADTQKKQSVSEASLENSSHFQVKLEDETRDLKKKLSQIRKQLEDEQNAHIEALRNAEKMQERLQKLELENSRLKCKVNTQPGKTEQLQKNPLRENLSEGIKEHLDTLTESIEYLEYALDEEKKKNGELQNELTRFKELFKMTKAKLNEEENGDFCFHGDFQSNELDIPFNRLMHKARAASQENLEQLRETNSALVRSQMELRIKDLESELYNMKIQGESTKVQLENYKQLYLEEFNTINVLFSKLNKAYEKLEVVQTKRLLEKQQHRSLLSTLTTRPVLQYPCGSNLDHSLAFQRSFLL